jgi:hypothetical protein
MIAGYKDVEYVKSDETSFSIMLVVYILAVSSTSIYHKKSLADIRFERPHIFHCFDRTDRGISEI